MKRLLVMLSMAAAMAVIAPAISPSIVISSASAEDSCDPNGDWAGTEEGPVWWGAVSATKYTGSRKVLAVRDPWRLNSPTYLWDYNDDLRQKWYMDCVGYDYVQGRNNWLMRFANHIELCLQVTQFGSAPQLKTCNAAAGNQIWQLLPQAATYIPVENWTLTPVAIHNPGSNTCLDVLQNGTVNGTAVVSWSCHFASYQLWY